MYEERLLMAVYFLAQNVSAVQTVAAIGSSTNPIVLAPASESGAGSPPTDQIFVLLVAGSGAVSASAQIVGSNDGVNFVNYGAAVAAAAAPTVSAQAQAGTSPFQYYSAIITAISGTNAVASVTVGM